MALLGVDPREQSLHRLAERLAEGQEEAVDGLANLVGCQACQPTTTRSGHESHYYRTFTGQCRSWAQALSEKVSPTRHAVSPPATATE